MKKYSSIGFYDPTTYFNQSVYNKIDKNTHTFPYFFMIGLVICVKLKIYVPHFYTWTFIHITDVHVAKRGKTSVSIET